MIEKSRFGRLKKILSITLLIMLGACVPSQTSEQSTPNEITTTMGLEQSPTTTLTSTIHPTPTSPPISMYDFPSWPKEMRDYFTRPPDKWDYPTQEYISDSEFDTWLIKIRREFLFNQGLLVAGELSIPDLMVAYEKWAFEQKQIMIWSPSEIRNVLQGDYRISWAEAGSKQSNFIRHGGILAELNLLEPPDQKRYDLVAKNSFQVSIFGKPTFFTRPSFVKAYLILTGVVQIPGIDPNTEVLTFGTYSDDGKPYFLLISIPLKDVNHNAGDRYLFNNEFFTYPENIILPSAIEGGRCLYQDGCPDRKKLTLNDLLTNYGNVIGIHSFPAPVANVLDINNGHGVTSDLDPLNIERGFNVSFNDPKELTIAEYRLPWE